jgi:hypothetical protein
MSRRKIKNRARFLTGRDPRSPFERIELPDGFRFGFGDGIRSKPSRAVVEEMTAYIKAHHLLPDTFIFDGSTGAKRLVARAARMVRESKSGDDDRLAAIVLLGHSPCELAVKTLARFVETSHPLAGTARFALSECLQLYMSPYAGVAPEGL